MTYTFKIKDQVYKIDIEKEKDQTVIQIDGKDIPVEFQKIDDNLYSIILENKSLTIGVSRNGKNLQVFMDGDLYEVEAISERDQRKSPQELSGVQEIKSPMPSRIVKILKEVGDEVEVDEGVIVLEAMKIEIPIIAPERMKVEAITIAKGQTVKTGQVLFTLILTRHCYGRNSPTVLEKFLTTPLVVVLCLVLNQSQECLSIRYRVQKNCLKD